VTIAMLILHLLRHAKSSWDEPAVDDFDRPLAKRGTKAGRLVATYLAEHEIRPDLVLCSTARRTRETLGLVAPAFGRDTRTQIDDAFYLASAEQLLRSLRAVAPGPRHVLVIGHNPGLHELALDLAPDDDDPQRQAMAAKFPTAALAGFEIKAAHWAALRPGENRLLRFVTPAMLARED